MSMSSSESLLKDEHTGLAHVRIWNTITRQESVIVLLLLQELDYKEFKMFAMACIDRQMEIEERKKRQSERDGGEEGRDAGRGWCAIQ